MNIVYVFTHNCFYDHILGHKTEIWDFDLIGDDESFLVTGSTDNEIRLWQLLHREEREDDRDKETEVYSAFKEMTGTLPWFT